MKIDDGALWDDTEIVCAAIRELKRLAVDGVAPSANEYTRGRSPGAPGVSLITKRVGWNWAELARRAGLEYFSGRQHERGDPMARTLPDYVQVDLKFEHTCECGAPAVFVGRFVTISGDGNRVGNAVVLCERCAGLVDKGVRVERIGDA